GFIGEEGAEEIEGVGGFVDVDVEVGEGGAEEDEVAAAVVGVAVCGGEGHDVAAELAGVDWEAAEAVDEVVQGAVAVFVVAELPDGAAL
ncbi:MAG: hypothetical protein Q9180_005917, partial [Flavoplaca navasiana]